MRARLLPLALLVLAPPAAAANIAADAQGWAGPGWYVSSDAPASTDPAFGPANILFNGPHHDRGACEAVYLKLYAPIGACRYVTLKPGPHAAR